MIARIKNLSPARLYEKYSLRPRARNDYATHVPILIGLARTREIKSVLEFGCGYYSTLTFLNRLAFPHLERLQSVENDASWAETLGEVGKNDERWILNLVEGEIAESVPGLNIEGYDLILIDDSKNSAQRASTIRTIANEQPQRPWIVIHDFEIKEYQNAASGFEQRYIFKAYNPQTGLVCNKAVSGIKSLARLLKEKSRTLEADDVKGWLNVFRNQ